MGTIATQKFSRDSSQRQPVRAAHTPVAKTRSLSTVSSGSTVLQRKPGCACGGGCPRCQEQGLLQTKLKISEPGDQYEQEADRIADEVMRMPEPSVQRQVDLEEEEGEEEMVQRQVIANQITPLVQQQVSPEIAEEDVIQRKAIDNQLTASASAQESSQVSSTVNEALSSPGQPLDLMTRLFMERHFGHDFSGVRIHTGKKADAATRVVNAYAYTVGGDIVFAAGRFNPQTSEGRRLLAHELTHVVQQSVGVHQLQRWANCKPARLSLEDCPPPEPEERRRAHSGPMVFLDLEDPVTGGKGVLIANFDIGSATVKRNLHETIDWNQFLKKIAADLSQWEILGFTDCQGNENLNRKLREDRAANVFSILPPGIKSQTISHKGAPIHECITENSNSADRTLNRSIAFIRKTSFVDVEPEVIEGNRPKPKSQPTVDCSQSKKTEIAQAHPMAVAMVEKALSVLAQRKTPAIESLLKNYFNDASTSTYLHVVAGFQRTLSGLKSGVKIECENQGSLLYSSFCSSSKSDVTIAYVRSLVGFHIHLCEAAFGTSDLDLAQTFVHEFSHMFDFTDDEEYCPNGCSSSLSRWDAYDNADSYAGFAKEAYLTL